MKRTIYIITISKINPGSPEGAVAGLWEDATDELSEAEMIFTNLVLTQEYFRKELWVKDPTGKRRLLKEERFGH